MKISILFEALTGKFETDSKRASKSFEKDMKAIEASAVKAGKVAGAALVAGGTALVAFVQAQTEVISQYQDIAEKIGDTAEAVASLKLAADVSETSFDTITAASVKLTAGLAKTDDETKGVGAALKDLGLDFDAFVKMSPVDQLEAIANAMGKFEEGAGKTAAAVRLLGKSGAELIPFLNDLAEGSERQITLTQEQIETADAYAKKVNRLKSELSILASAAASELIPVFSTTLDTVKDLITGTGDLNDASKAIRDDGGLKEFAQDSAIALAVLGESLVGVGKLVGAVGKSIQVVYTDIATAVKLIYNAATFDNQGIIDAFAERERVIKEANQRYVDLIGYNGTATSDALRKAFAEENKVRAEQLNLLPTFASAPMIYRDGAGDAPQAVPYRLGMGPNSPNKRPSLPTYGSGSPDKNAKAAKEAQSEAQRLIASMQEQLALYGDLTHAQEVRISLEKDYYGEVSPQQAAELVRLAELLDTQDAQVEALKKTAELKKEIDAADQEALDNFEDVRDFIMTEEETIKESYARRIAVVKDAVDRKIVGEERAAEIIDKLNKKQIEDLKKGADEMDEYAKEAAKSIQDALADNLFNGFDKGLKGLVSSVGDTLKRIAAEIVAADLARLLFGSDPGGTGGFGGLVGMGISAVSEFFGFGGAFAKGGNPPIGIPSLVGEEGPELIIPKSASTVVPLHSRTGETNVYQTFAIQAPGGVVSRQSQMQVGAEAARGLATAGKRNN